MKSKLLILSLLSFMISYGQQYERIVDTTKLWSTLYQSALPYTIFKTNYSKFSGDTVIGSDHFMKIYQSTDSLQLNYVETAYIREDSTHKVYYRNLQGTHTYLIYDFNAEVGDTITIWGHPSMIVDTVDSVYIGNAFRKRIHFSYWGGESWIEGIGSMRGVLGGWWVGAIGGGEQLLCYFENNILKYHNPGYVTCYYDYVGINESERPAIRVTILPNPVVSTSVLRIESILDKEYILEIYSIHGERIKTCVIQKNIKVFIHKSDYASGLYMYRLITSSSEVITGKFIVE